MLQTAAQRVASMANMEKAKAAPKEKIYPSIDCELCTVD